MNRLDRYEFIWKAVQKHGYKYDYRKVNYINNSTKVCIICPIHGEFLQNPNAHLQGQGCKMCGIIKNSMCNRSSTIKFINKAKKVHGYKYDYSKVNYINNVTKVCIICPIHGEFWQTPSDHLRGKKCKYCSRPCYNYNTTEFINKAKKVHGDKYDYSKVEYVNSQTKICIICPEHGEFWQTPSEHLIGCGCSKCAGKNKTFRELIKQFKHIHGEKYDYSKVEYTKANTKVCIICSKHGEFWQSPNKHLQGNGCPICNESKLEIEIKNLLDNNNIKYERQKKFKWLRYKKLMSLDFYLPDYNIGIECQGRQHFNVIDYFGGKDVLLEIIERDELKYNQCKEHGIEVLHYTNVNIPIDYKKYVYTDKNELLNYILTKIIKNA